MQCAGGWWCFGSWMNVITSHLTKRILCNWNAPTTNHFRMKSSARSCWFCWWRCDAYIVSSKEEFLGDSELFGAREEKMKHNRTRTPAHGVLPVHRYSWVRCSHYTNRKMNCEQWTRTQCQSRKPPTGTALRSSSDVRCATSSRCVCARVQAENIICRVLQGVRCSVNICREQYEFSDSFGIGYWASVLRGQWKNIK